jgi:hypothetical protein
LRRVISRALRAASRARAASTILPHDDLGVVGALLQVVGERLGHDVFHRAAHFAADQLVLGLAAELGLGHLDAQHAAQALAHVVAADLDLGLLGQLVVSMYLLITRVIAARRPVRWVPPSRCGMLLVKQSTCSL